MEFINKYKVGEYFIRKINIHIFFSGTLLGDYQAMTFHQYLTYKTKNFSFSLLKNVHNWNRRFLGNIKLLKILFKKWNISNFT